MIEFPHPWYLFLLAAVPLLVWRWLRRGRRAFRYPGTEWIAHLQFGRSRLAQWGGAGARAAALVLMILALAGMRWPDRSSRIATEGIAIQMLADVSGSMAERDFDWNGEPMTRLDAVKRAFRLFVAGGEGPDGVHFEGRRTDQVGLVAFAAWPETACPLTLSHAVLLRLLEEQQPRVVPTQAQTNIGDAIAWGLLRLESTPASRKVMILLSDGEHNVPPPALTPRQAAQLAANQQVPIYAIDAGGDVPAEEGNATGQTEATATQIRQSGEQALQAVAQITGGRFFKARDTQSLLTVCQEIDRLERRPIESFQYRRYFEGYPWLGLGAFVLWFSTRILEMTWWLRLP